MKIAVISLGCPKNQVDADRFTHALIKDGHQTVPSVELAEAVIINTCGFIDPAKEEAIETVLDVCEMKKHNPNFKVIVSGCLAERYKDDIAKELPEVDAVVGIGSNKDLPAILKELSETPGKTSLCRFGSKLDLPLDTQRVISTPQHYAWLKIADGCDNVCSYCAIPGIRGPLRSACMDSVIKEAKWLAEQGVKEVVLVAQDVTAYGDDKGNNQIIPLLHEIEKINGIQWIRLLYAYPERITEELLTTMAKSKKIVPYLDLPIQHCNDEILKSMRRRGGAKAVHKAIEMIREKLPNAVLRTSLIVGYPGETKQQFEELCDFVRDVKFDRLGCFAFSAQDGTPAAEMPNQVPEEEAQKRADIIMQLQERILQKKQADLQGQTLQVICDEWDEDREVFLCRAACDAPEIDVNILVDANQQMKIGEFYTVNVVDAADIDVRAVLV